MTMENPPPSAPEANPGSPIGLFFRVLQMRLRFIVIFVLAGLVVAYWERIDAWYDRLTRPVVEKPEINAGTFEYRCPMHPSVVREQPGSCYICGMPLVKRPKGQPVELAADALARVQLTPQKMVLGSVATSPVEPLLLVREMRQYGDIEPDQTRVVDVPAKVRGRIEKLYVSFDGEFVHAGQVLLDLYSQDLYQAERDFVTALRKSRQFLAGQSAQSELTVARSKLQSVGASPELIRELEQSPQAQGNVLVYAPIDVPIVVPVASPVTGNVMKINAVKGQSISEGDTIYQIADLSKVWLQIRVFEDQFENIKPGTAIEVHTTAFPDRSFIGKVTFIAPRVDPSTRTVAARVEVDNPDYQLRPGMYAEAVIRTPAGKLEVLNADLAAKERKEKEPVARSETPSPKPVPMTGNSSTLLPQTLIDAYLQLAQTLADDKLNPDAIQVLTRCGEALPEKDHGELRLAIADLAKAKSLEATRDAMVSLGDKLIAALTKTGQLHRYFVVYCSMKPGFWLQTGEEVANPFFGSGMLRCGKITQKPESGAATNQSSNPSAAANPTSPPPSPTTGYYCPLTPDRLYAHPGACPIERAPMVYARLEPILAVPASAVIDTGRHKFVYREADPAAWGAGVFDLVEVKLGPEAKGPEGRYYPVLSGLKAGEHVVTRGTFAVDAENRLSGRYPQ